MTVSVPNARELMTPDNASVSLGVSPPKTIAELAERLVRYGLTSGIERSAGFAGACDRMDLALRSIHDRSGKLRTTAGDAFTATCRSEVRAAMKCVGVVFEAARTLVRPEADSKPPLDRWEISRLGAVMSRHLRAAATILSEAAEDFSILPRQLAGLTQPFTEAARLIEECCCRIEAAPSFLSVSASEARRDSVVTVVRDGIPHRYLVVATGLAGPMKLIHADSNGRTENLTLPREDGLRLLEGGMVESRPWSVLVPSLPLCAELVPANEQIDRGMLAPGTVLRGGDTLTLVGVRDPSGASKALPSTRPFTFRSMNHREILSTDVCGENDSGPVRMKVLQCESDEFLPRADYSLDETANLDHSSGASVTEVRHGRMLWSDIDRYPEVIAENFSTEACSRQLLRLCQTVKVLPESGEVVVYPDGRAHVVVGADAFGWHEVGIGRDGLIELFRTSDEGLSRYPKCTFETGDPFASLAPAMRQYIDLSESSVDNPRRRPTWSDLAPGDEIAYADGSREKVVAVRTEGLPNPLVTSIFQDPGTQLTVRRERVRSNTEFSERGNIVGIQVSPETADLITRGNELHPYSAISLSKDTTEAIDKLLLAAPSPYLLIMTGTLHGNERIPERTAAILDVISESTSAMAYSSERYSQIASDGSSHELPSLAAFVEDHATNAGPKIRILSHLAFDGDGKSDVDPKQQQMPFDVWVDTESGIVTTATFESASPSNGSSQIDMSMDLTVQPNQLNTSNRAARWIGVASAPKHLHDCCFTRGVTSVLVSVGGDERHAHNLDLWLNFELSPQPSVQPLSDIILVAGSGGETDICIDQLRRRGIAHPLVHIVESPEQASAVLNEIGVSHRNAAPDAPLGLRDILSELTRHTPGTIPPTPSSVDLSVPIREFAHLNRLLGEALADSVVCQLRAVRAEQSEAARTVHYESLTAAFGDRMIAARKALEEFVPAVNHILDHCDRHTDLLGAWSAAPGASADELEPHGTVDRVVAAMRRRLDGIEPAILAQARIAGVDLDTFKKRFAPADFDADLRVARDRFADVERAASRVTRGYLEVETGLSTPARRHSFGQRDYRAFDSDSWALFAPCTSHDADPSRSFRSAR